MKPTNPLVSPMLTDLYQLKMAYGAFKLGRHKLRATFDLFFRKHPFGGEFSIFAGQDEALALIENFRFTPEQIDHIQTKLLPDADPEFFTWLSQVDCSGVKVSMQIPGPVSPRVPLIKVQGDMAVGHLLETPLLTLVNYPTLIATNAMRMRLAFGWDKTMLEFGLRRAQGPDGGLSASKYSYWGGFNATSNVLGSEIFDLPCSGTNAHAWIQSFGSFQDIPFGGRKLLNKSTGQQEDFVEDVLNWRDSLNYQSTHSGELAAFIAFALVYPDGFLTLVDTYNTLESGVPNFICVAMALLDFGYHPKGIRLDSGDLAFLSKEARNMFRAVTDDSSVLTHCTIAASNDLDEAALYALKEQGHEIDVVGIGTNLVTCVGQPAFGAVYKLVEIEGRKPIKLSEQIEKITIPGDKQAYRLYGADGHAILDLMTLADEPAPKPGKRILCRHPFIEIKRAYVTPTEVFPLLMESWDGRQAKPFPHHAAIHASIAAEMESLREDHLRSVNPTPYKVSVSEKLYGTIHSLLASESPIPELV